MEVKRYTNEVNNNGLPSEDEPASIVVLNDDCLLMVFECLDLYDCINFAQTCVRLQILADCNVYPVRFSTFTFNHQMLNNRKHRIGDVLSQIGPHLRNLRLTKVNIGETPRYGCACVDYHINDISEKCTNLESLTIDHWCCYSMPSLDDFDSLTNFTLESCKFSVAIDYNTLPWKTSKIISFKVINCRSFDRHVFLKLCQSSPNIKCMVIENAEQMYEFSDIFQSLFQKSLKKAIPFLEQLESLSLGIADVRDCEDLYPLLLLRKLKKLRLVSADYAILDPFLKKLAKTNTIEELEIHNVIVTSQTLDTLESFKKLNLLVVRQADIPFRSKLLSRDFFPPNLKLIQLENFEISFNDFIAMVKHKCIEKINLFHCKIISNWRHSRDIDDLSAKILEIQFRKSVNSNKLTITLPLLWREDDNNKTEYWFESHKLKIVNSWYYKTHSKPNKICIDFSCL